MIRTLISLIFLFPLLASNSFGTPTYFPPTLAEWAQWIRAKNPSWECAAGRGEERICNFPSTLTYTLTTHGASFVLSGEMLAPGEIPIPGSSQAIPTNISIEPGGYLHQNDGSLLARLPVGPFTIRGEFPHLTNTTILPVPDTIGLVNMHPVPGVSPSGEEMEPFALTSVLRPIISTLW